MIENKRFLSTLVPLLLTAVLATGIARRGEPVVLQTNLETFPHIVSGFSGSDDRFSEKIYGVLNADQNVYRHYRGAEGKQVDLYIGYYGTAKGGRTGHNPYGCLPGAGWAIVERGQISVPVSYHSGQVDLNYVVARKDGVSNVLVHWYQSAGTHVLTTGLQQNIQRFVGRVLYNRNDGAYVQVSAFTGEDQISETKEMVKEFARSVLEQLPDYWPVEG